MNKLQWVINQMKNGVENRLDIMSLENIATAERFHRSFPQYAPTPLQKLPGMAKRLGIASLAVKDESYRFGLNAFKVLGGSYAMARYIARETGREIGELSYSALTSQELRQAFGQATFFTATDGNHGRGVAWAARQLGQQAVVHMPKGTSQARYDHVANEGAHVTIEELNYDQCVRLAAAEAAETEHGVVIQDTAWEGYEEVPTWIMQGYGTMIREAVAQLEEPPTHVFIQAGVGSLAGAVVAYLTNCYGAKAPRFIVMETEAADCLYRSAVAEAEMPHAVDGDLSTIMAGLACGEANPISYQILRSHVDTFLSCSDHLSARGMRLLAAPVKGDPTVVSGESGAIGMGCLDTIMTDSTYAALKDHLGLDATSRVLLFSTEGNTDPGQYERIVWGGEYPSY